jgi:hypothetical protein
MAASKLEETDDHPFRTPETGDMAGPNQNSTGDDTGDKKSARNKAKTGE